ncbi:MAG: AbrB/MazE/SpoVT family DNA-binding domain-containing protein [Candidatus Hydrothermarchaeales archaeon]
MEENVYVDKQGRIYLPKEIRDKIGIRIGMFLDVVVKDKKVVFEPRKSIVRESKGIFRTKEPVEEIDRLAEEATYEEVAGDL